MRVLTIGTFDIPHAGHAAFLRKCGLLGDVTVGINTDRFVAEYKGGPPTYTQAERIQLIEDLGYSTASNDGPGRNLIERLRPDLVAIGSDWLHRDYLAQIDMTADDFDRLNMGLAYVPYTKGISTSDIRSRL